LWRKRIQLGLIHMAVAMTLAPINSTLNRVMIKELAFSATLVALLASLPYLFSPIQVAIGAFADRHPLGGLRRTPYIILGLALCALGVMFAPNAAFLLATDPLRGLLLAFLVFGAWGMGYNFASVSYFALATEISGEEGRSRTIGTMFFLMIVGIIATSIGLSRLLEVYTPQTLTAAFRWVAGLAFGLGLLGTLGVEPRFSALQADDERGAVGLLWQAARQGGQVRLFFLYLILLLAAILGQDVLLEPFAAEAFGMSVEATTRLTSIWGGCFLVALLLTGALEARLGKRRTAQFGAWMSIAAFAAIGGSGLVGSAATFYLGVILLGLGTGIATVANLALMLDMTVAGQVGLFIGAWGMASALARLVGGLIGGALRDGVTLLAANPVAGYIAVFGAEALILLLSLALLARLDIGRFQQQTAALSLSERAALLNEAA
jgi:BCD family chlorophyll transporter-like MFS transporter